MHFLKITFRQFLVTLFCTNLTNFFSDFLGLWFMTYLIIMWNYCSYVNIERTWNWKRGLNKIKVMYHFSILMHPYTIIRILYPLLVPHQPTVSSLFSYSQVGPILPSTELHLYSCLSPLKYKMTLGSSHPPIQWVLEGTAWNWPLTHLSLRQKDKFTDGKYVGLMDWSC